jgi:hypothetical protein
VSDKDLLQGLPPYLFATAAAVSFALAVYLALHDRKAASGILAGMALVAALLAYLPQLDSLSAFAVNVKLRSSLDRADEILTKLRNLTIVNAKLGYTTLAWGNRLGTPKASAKQRILDEIDDQLSNMNVSEDERAEIKRSYVRFIAFDFYELYTRSINYALSRRMEQLQAKLSAEPNDGNRAAAQEFNTKSSEWRSRLARISLEEIPIDGFRKFLHDNTSVDTFSSEETVALNKIADEIADLFLSSRQKGGYTKEAAEFYDRYYDGMSAALYRRVFAEQ